MNKFSLYGMIFHVQVAYDKEPIAKQEICKYLSQDRISCEEFQKTDVSTNFSMNKSKLSELL